jgi:type IV secretion system protein VirB11
LRPFLDREDVTEILVNRPGEVWVEAAGQPAMTCHAIPALSDRHLARLAQQVARISHQGINRASPLLGAVLPDGARVQFVAPRPRGAIGPWPSAVTACPICRWTAGAPRDLGRALRALAARP